MIKIKDGFQIRKILEKDVVTAPSDVFNGIIKLNETGALIWNGIASGASREEIAGQLAEEYTVTEEKALADVNRFIDDLLEKGVLQEC